MHRHSINTASFFTVLIVVLIFSLSLAGVAAAQTNTSLGTGALQSNTTGSNNTALGADALFFNTTGEANTAIGSNALIGNTTGDFNTATGVEALRNNTTGGANTASGVNALFSNSIGTSNSASGVNALRNNTTGFNNTASGTQALFSNATGSENTAIGFGADVSFGDLTNATAIGFGALVNASNKVRLGNGAVAVIEGQVAFTAAVSDKTKKENFKPVDGEAVLGKIRGFELSSWNFIGHDPKEFRHYGPMAQDFFAAFGQDGVGQIGTETTINSGDLAGILMIAVQALEKRTAELKQKEAQIAELTAKQASFEAMAARLEALELRINPIQITAEKSLGDKMVNVMP
jgi:Tfp pilus assembly protein PilV